MTVAIVVYKGLIPVVGRILTISRAKHELSTAIAEARKEKYLTKEEVKTMCGVCDTTLWHWSKKNYLKPVKVGNKVRYRQSDIQRILGEHNPLI